MGQAAIPVDLTNPGQVFACMGFMEAADMLLGNAEGGFDWAQRHDPIAKFTLQAKESENPVARILEYFVGAEVCAVAPKRSQPSKAPKKRPEDADTSIPSMEFECSEDSPAAELSDMALPIVIGGGNRPKVRLGHWADGSSRDDFKLYAGNRSALSIMRTMIDGKITKAGRVQLNGITQLWDAQHDELIADPFGTVTPMGGSFNFDARCAWEAIDAGYSPDAQNQKVIGSPVVEMLAVWGLENARPRLVEGRVYRYAAWRGRLTPLMARPALAGCIETIEGRHFRVQLGLSGKNKVVQYGQEEM